MSIRMFKALFPNTNVDILKKSIDKNVVLHAYNNSCIPQMGISKIKIINNGIKFWCNFSVEPGNGPALLGMPDHERIEPLSFNCDTTNIA